MPDLEDYDPARKWWGERRKRKAKSEPKEESFAYVKRSFLQAVMRMARKRNKKLAAEVGRILRETKW